MSGYGDPAWDLATALAGSSALELGTGRPGQSDREAVVHGYFGAGGPADPARVALFWPPRVVHLALECAEAGDRQSGVELLNLAELLFLGRADLEGMIREWCSTFRQE
jgi:hypothetical protein